MPPSTNTSNTPSLFALPTDTCYGLACRFDDALGYMGIYALKGRAYTKPLAVIVRSFADVREMIEITEEQGEFLTRYPVPFTIVGKARSLPPFLEPQQYTTLGIRVAERALDTDIIAQLSFPLFLTSANRSGMPELMTREAVRDEFSDSVTILGEEALGGAPSNIFMFIGETTELHFFRKNYS